MKYILQLALGSFLAVAAAFAGEGTSTKAPHAVPATIDTGFTPQVGVEYSLEEGTLYHHDHRTNPGPAEVPTSTAWSFANEFVYRTALAKDYVVPAAGAGPIKDGWRQVDFTSKDGKSRLIVEVHVERRVARLRPQNGQQSGEANAASPRRSP